MYNESCDDVLFAVIIGSWSWTTCIFVDLCVEVSFTAKLEKDTGYLRRMYPISHVQVGQVGIPAYHIHVS